jgi:hypothetical protein
MGVKRLRVKAEPAAEGNPPFYWWEDDVLTINILDKPSASRDPIGKPRRAQLKISLTAAPELG